MRLASVVSVGAALCLATPGAVSARPSEAGTPLSYGTLSRWAYPLYAVAARAAPRPDSPVMTIVSPSTPEGESNLLLALVARTDRSGRAWVRVRLAILPNNSTGWVPRDALGELHLLRTHLVVDRRRLTAVLYRGGRAIFWTSVGVGRPGWPTPKGEFYVRERLTGFGDAFYGPVAFGTSARSAVLTDWPGGGYIGIHGTSLPDLLPGRVSHGCIRMRNDAILRLRGLMPLGTPLTIV